jgi:hypothetical protein
MLRNLFTKVRVALALVLLLAALVYGLLAAAAVIGVVAVIGLVIFAIYVLASLITGRPGR